MKRIWFGAALLGLLLALGIGSSSLMERTYLSISENLNEAADFAMDGNWFAARQVTSAARKNWDRKRPLIAALSDHEPMDEAEGFFAQLEIYSQSQDAISYSGACRYLARQMEALGKSHSLNIQNFL